MILKKKNIDFIKWIKPQTIKDLLSLNVILDSKGELIKKIIKHKYPISIIFYGPPGVGKSILASTLANSFNLKIAHFNSALDKKEHLEKIVYEAKKDPTILIIEEIHRINRDRQDIILQALDQNNLTIFASTTENPYFVVNPALRSRCQIIEIKPINHQKMFKVLKTLIKKIENKIDLKIEDIALQEIAQSANGDMRYALNILELIFNLYYPKIITPQIVNQIIQKNNLRGARYGDHHYDLLSAFQKSIRGSDVDASLHYLSQLLANGDHQSLLRRLLVTAYEDIGLANPIIAVKVKSAIDSFYQIGLPEGIIPLGLVVIEMALSQKSNSAYLAIQKAYKDVTKNGMSFLVPTHLRDSSYASSVKLGHGVDYKYAHNYPNHYVKQQYLPHEIKNIKYFTFNESNLYEKKLAQIYQSFTNKKV